MNFTKSKLLGALAGDIIGSRFEWNNYRATDFDMFHTDCEYTDDSVLTIGVARAFEDGLNFTHHIQDFAQRYPGRGYGGFFSSWIYADDPKPYGSFGNGSAMRASACGHYAKSLDEAMEYGKLSAECTHSHPEGIKGAQAVAVAIYMARMGESKDAIRLEVETRFEYDLSRTCDQIRPTYMFNETCQGTVPEAIIAFLESEDFEHSIRLGVSLGGDSDTLAAITGSIAEAFYGGVGEEIGEFVWRIIPAEFREVVERFQ